MMFSRPFQDIEIADVVDLINTAYPESDDVEYKEYVPGKDGPDPWHDGADGIKDYARNELLAAVVALANSRGGHLLVGIIESADKPHRAIGQRLVPRVADLADRLRAAANDLIEPRLADLQIAGIQVEGRTEGFLIARVRQSAAAPHRLASTMHCYVRRGASTAKLTMREIQDLTMQRVGGVAHLDERASELSRVFESDHRFRNLDFRNIVAGICCTVVPIFPLGLSRPDLEAALTQSGRQFSATYRSGGHDDLFFPLTGYTSRYCLRGFVIQDGGGSLRYEHAAFLDGSQRVVYFGGKDGMASPGGAVFAAWMLGMVASALDVAAFEASQVSNPATEFAVDVHYRTNGTEPALRMVRGRTSNPIPESAVHFPRLSFIPEDGLAPVLRELEGDIHNAAGLSYTDEIVAVERA